MDRLQQSPQHCAFYLFNAPQDYNENCCICLEEMDPQQIIFAHLSKEQQLSLDKGKEALNDLEERVTVGQLTSRDKEVQQTAFATLREITKGAVLHPIHFSCFNTWSRKQLESGRLTISCPGCRQSYYQPILDDVIFCADPDLLTKYLKIQNFISRFDILKTIHGLVCIVHYIPEHIQIVAILLNALEREIPKQHLEMFLENATFNGNVEVVELLCDKGQLSPEKKEEYLFEAQRIREEDPAKLDAERMEQMISKMTPQDLKNALYVLNSEDEKKQLIEVIQKSSREDLKAVLKSH